MISKSVRRVAQTTQRQARFATAVQDARSIEQMKKSKHDFVHFINQAALDADSKERNELYKYLVQCFIDNDTDYDGLVSYRGFNSMIAEAALAPRRFGFAPHTREMFSSKEEFDLQRVSMFKELSHGNARMTLESWLNWAMPHIKEKVGSGLIEHNEARWERSEEDFKSFMKGIAKETSSLNTKSSTSTQYKEFYLMNNNNFMAADVNMEGLLNQQQLDGLLEVAKQVPSKYGLDWYSNVKMSDVTSGQRCSFSDFQAFQVKMVLEKAKSL